ncbi:regulator of nonsense transcripts 2 [Elysia marginata]|uniref:Regulator of nonsense transcripts 2 n=1 Tax=Elysia marginata TaxID=1093978 RepID=A0AAV4I6H1_9GAST|nr:regulator of nonsense transcripts 2 [Elysia marginata]
MSAAVKKNENEVADSSNNDPKKSSNKEHTKDKGAPTNDLKGDEDPKQKEQNEEQQKEAEATAARLKEEELKTLQAYIAECSERIRWKTDARTVNLSAPDNRPDESFFSNLDSSLKKNTAFIKKLVSLILNLDSLYMLIF